MPPHSNRRARAAANVRTLQFLMADHWLSDVVYDDGDDTLPARIRVGGPLVTLLRLCPQFATLDPENDGSLRCAHAALTADLLAGFRLGEGVMPVAVKSRVTGAKLDEGIRVLFKETDMDNQELANWMSQPGALQAECRRRRDALSGDSSEAALLLLTLVGAEWLMPDLVGPIFIGATAF